MTEKTNQIITRELVESEISELLSKFKHSGFKSPRLIIRSGILYLVPKSSIMPHDWIAHALSDEDLTFGFTSQQWDFIVTQVLNIMKDNPSCQRVYKYYRLKNQTNCLPTSTPGPPAEKHNSQT